MNHTKLYFLVGVDTVIVIIIPIIMYATDGNCFSSSIYSNFDS